MKNHGRFLLAVFCLWGFVSTAKAVTPRTKTVKVDRSDGLVRIDQEGAYIYDEVRTIKKQSGHLRLGSANQPEIEININDVTYYFEDFYGSTSGATVGYDYEYFFTTNNGKLGGQIGAAFQVANGNGRLVRNPPELSTPSVERFMFVTVPVYLGAVYRFQYTDRPWFAPYVAGGGVVVGLAEKREDTSAIKTTAGYGFYGSGGALFNVSIIDRQTSLTLDSEYGIGNLWINLEFKFVSASSDTFKYENSYVQGGLSFDY